MAASGRHGRHFGGRGAEALYEMTADGSRLVWSVALRAQRAAASLLLLLLLLLGLGLECAAGTDTGRNGRVRKGWEVWGSLQSSVDSGTQGGRSHIIILQQSVCIAQCQ